jgi:hypothetical protein
MGLFLLLLFFGPAVLAVVCWVWTLLYALTTPARKVPADSFYGIVCASWLLVLAGVLTVFALVPLASGPFMTGNSRAAWWGFITVLTVAWTGTQGAALAFALSLMRNAGFGRPHMKALLTGSLACIGGSVISVLVFGWGMSQMAVS